MHKAFIRDGDLTILHKHNSLSDLCTSAMSHNGYQMRLSSKSDFIGRRFKNLKDACGALFVPHEETHDLFLRAERELGAVKIPPPESIKRRRRWSDDDGDELCPDRLRSGGHAWSRMHRPIRRGPSEFSVVVNLSTSSYYGQEHISYKGAVAAIIANKLQKAGYRCQIIGMAHVNNVYKSWPKQSVQITSVLLKPASRNVDRTVLANGLSGWGYRSVWHSERWNPAAYPNGETKDDANICKSLGGPQLLTSQALSIAGIGTRKTQGVIVVDRDCINRYQASLVMQSALAGLSESLID